MQQQINVFVNLKYSQTFKYVVVGIVSELKNTIDSIF